MSFMIVDTDSLFLSSFSSSHSFLPDLMHQHKTPCKALPTTFTSKTPLATDNLPLDVPNPVPGNPLGKHQYNRSKHSHLPISLWIQRCLMVTVMIRHVFFVCESHVEVHHWCDGCDAGFPLLHLA